MSELSRETQELLARGRDVAMPRGRRARVKGAVLAQIAATSVAGTSIAGASLAGASTASTSGTALGGAAKLVVAIAVGGAVGAGAYTGAQQWGASRPAAAPSAVNAPPRATSNAHTANAPERVVSAPVEPPHVEAPEPTARESVRAPEPPRDAPRAHPAAPPITTAPQRAHPATAPPDPGAPLPVPVAARSEPAPDAPPAPSTALAPASPTHTSLTEEARLLRDASAAVQRGDGARALALLDEHAARFPAGALSPERDAQRIFALCALGRSSEARARAESFLSAQPSGPLAARVRASCAAR